MRLRDHGCANSRHAQVLHMGRSQRGSPAYRDVGCPDSWRRLLKNSIRGHWLGARAADRTPKVMTGGTGRNRPSQRPGHHVGTTQTLWLKPRPKRYSRSGHVCYQQVSLCMPKGSSTVIMDRCEAVYLWVHATRGLQAVTRASSGERPQLLANTYPERCSGGDEAVGMPTL